MPARWHRDAIPQFIRVGDAMHERDRGHGGTRQTLLTKRRGERFIIGESEEIWALWEIRRRRGPRLPHRIQEHADQPVLAGTSPCREGQPAAGPEHACAFSDGALWTREVHDREVADDRVEGGVGKRQFVRVRPTELKRRMSAASARDHRCRDVDAHHRRSTLRSLRGNPPRSRGDIQNPRPIVHRGRHQEGPDHPADDPAEKALIGGSLLLPAHRLEGVESVVHGRVAHAQTIRPCPALVEEPRTRRRRRCAIHLRRNSDLARW